MTDIRVLLVDDHTVVRAGLRLLLEREEGVVVVDEGSNADEALYRMIEHKPDVLLIDVTMPGASGIEALPKLLEVSPHTKGLVLSMHDDPSYVRDAFAAGASGYVLKDAADEEVVAAIRQVAAGEHYVNPALGARMAVADAKQAAQADSDPLSSREHEILRFLALGYTNQEIAKELVISVRTVETHRAHIMRKLGVGSRAELVRYALVNRIIEAE